MDRIFVSHGGQRKWITNRGYEEKVDYEKADVLELKFSLDRNQASRTELNYGQNLTIPHAASAKNLMWGLRDSHNEGNRLGRLEHGLTEFYRVERRFSLYFCFIESRLLLLDLLLCHTFDDLCRLRRRRLHIETPSPCTVRFSS
ncbi:hypothetical protein Tco_0876973 [Tanacetum coccineum]|uniref:Uncharacterized protein n=1 Tax=Tanacetum coccineum TaxID=301880 RepID=A0ABQ5BWT8_9ASTR